MSNLVQNIDISKYIIKDDDSVTIFKLPTGVDAYSYLRNNTELFKQRYSSVDIELFTRIVTCKKFSL